MANFEEGIRRAKAKTAHDESEGRRGKDTGIKKLSGPNSAGKGNPTSGGKINGR